MIIRKLIFILVANFIYTHTCAQSEPKKHWQFSSEFLAQHKPQKNVEQPVYTPVQPLYVQPTPYSMPNAYHEQPAQATDPSLFSYENAQRLINIATIVFATIKIYQRYQMIGGSPAVHLNDQSWSFAIRKFLASVCPALLKSVGTYGNFLIDSTTIVFEALIYKAIAKLLLLCAHGDVSDLIGSVAHHAIHTAKQLL